MCQSSVATPGGLSVTSHQCCGSRRKNIIGFVHILSILLCFHWLPATAMELLWCMVSCRFSRERLLDLKGLSSPGGLFCSLVCNLTCEHYSDGPIAAWKAHKEQERRGKEIGESFSEFPRSRRLSSWDCLCREHLEKAILVLFHMYKVIEAEPSQRRVLNDSGNLFHEKLRLWGDGKEAVGGDL